MDTIKGFSNASSGVSGDHDTEQNSGKFSMRVKALSERDRRSLLMHFLALNDDDRSLRFGTMLDDPLITRYVQRMNLSRDAIFGVYDNSFTLVGVGHLVWLAREAVPFFYDVTAKECIGEFGVSVLATARGLGIGSKLFERAAIHCRNADVDTLYMHCLESNQTVIHIAQKSGMQIFHTRNGAYPYLKLPPADPALVLPEAADPPQVTTFDCAENPKMRAPSTLLKTFPGPKAN
jgi:GNAT superfamily N-acetyltransferase